VDTRSSSVRFGPFALDPRTGELSKNGGTRIRLEGQPLEILLLLLDRPGELVTQEEIRKKLWPDGTVVHYEHSIKTALRKLRHALGDGADAPQYVETLPRRRYRLIPSIQAVPRGEPSVEDVARSEVPRNGGEIGRKAGVWFRGAVAVMILAGLTFGVYRYLRHAPALTERDTLLVSNLSTRPETPYLTELFGRA
jgi:DNA-binding winged helix-turn-helix (wHTH) protein